MHDARGRVEVLLADHDPLPRHAVRTALADRDDVRLVGEVRDSVDLVSSAQRLRPDVVLISADLGPAGAVAATIQLVHVSPRSRAVVFAVSEDPGFALEALQAGAAGYLTKDIDMESLARALRGVAAGEAAITRSMSRHVLDRLRTLSAEIVHMRPVNSPLSNRQWQVLELLAAGRSAIEIAHVLGVSPETVRSHRRRLLRGLQVASTDEAVRVARRLQADEGHPG